MRTGSAPLTCETSAMTVEPSAAMEREYVCMCVYMCVCYHNWGLLCMCLFFTLSDSTAETNKLPFLFVLCFKLLFQFLLVEAKKKKL